MSKKTGFRLFCLAAMVFILFIAQAQTEEQGWKKTLTLPSGEVVCDLNGDLPIPLKLTTGSGQTDQRSERSDAGEKIIQRSGQFESRGKVFSAWILLSS
jgi:hypothetical protein